MGVAHLCIDPAHRRLKYGRRAGRDAIAGDVPADAPEWAVWSDGTPAAALGAWLIPTPARLEPVIGGRFWFGSPTGFNGIVAELEPERHLLLAHHDGSGMMFTVSDTDSGTHFAYTHWLRPGPATDATTSAPAVRSSDPWAYKPLGEGTYPPALAAAWHGSLYNLDRLLGGQEPANDAPPEPGPTTKAEFPAPNDATYIAYCESFEARPLA